MILIGYHSVPCSVAIKNPEQEIKNPGQAIKNPEQDPPRGFVADGAHKETHGFVPPNKARLGQWECEWKHQEKGNPCRGEQ